MLALIFVFVAPTIVVWLILFTQSLHLFNAFRNRYPEEAQQRIKHAFESRRSPGRFFYFLSTASAKFLEEKKDSELLGKRRLIIRFSMAALVLALASLAVIMAPLVLIVFRWGK